MQITSINTLRVAFKLFYNARRYHSTSFCITDKAQRMAEMEAMCFLLHFETPIRQFASLSIMYIFLFRKVILKFFRKVILKFNTQIFLCKHSAKIKVQTNTNSKSKNVFLLFSNQCNCSSFMHFGIDCFTIFIRVIIFESWSGWCYSVVLGLYSQLCLGHTLGCAWVIYSDVLES